MMMLLMVKVGYQERSIRNRQRQVDISLANSAGGGDAFLVFNGMFIGYKSHFFLQLGKGVRAERSVAVALAHPMNAFAMFLFVIHHLSLKACFECLEWRRGA
jgi:hypothetical protein